MSNQHTDDSFMYTTDIPLDYFRGEYDEDNDDTPLDILGRPRVCMFARPDERAVRFPPIHNPLALEKLNSFLTSGYNVGDYHEYIDSILDEISLFGQRQEEAEKAEDTSRKHNHDYFTHVVSHDLPSRAFVDSLLSDISNVEESNENDEDDEDFGKTINDIMPNYSLMCESLTHEELSSLLKANLLAEIKKYNLKDMSTFDHLENAQIYLDQLNFIQMQEFTHNGNV